jgi:hypothetical protein
LVGSCSSQIGKMFSFYLAAVCIVGRRRDIDATSRFCFINVAFDFAIGFCFILAVAVAVLVLFLLIATLNNSNVVLFL